MEKYKIIRLKKAILILSLFIILEVFITFINAACPASMTGDGSIGNPCQITNCTQLQNMSLNLTASYKLMNNINCSATISWDSGAGFIPVGDSTNKFIGVFNGNNYTISNIYINRPGTDSIGLFGQTDIPCNISNVGLTNVNMTGNNYVGGLVGFSWYTYINIVSTTGFTYGAFSVGGLGGFIYGTNINNSYSEVKVTATSTQAGGFCGGATGNSNIYNSYSTGDVLGTNYVGGFCGQVGDMTGPGRFYNVFSTGNATGSLYIGGISGEMWSGASTLTNVYWNNKSNPPICVGSGSDTGCNAISNNKSYFYNVSNLPIINWSFPPWFSNNPLSYPTLIKITSTNPSNLTSEGNLSEWRMFQRWLNHTSWDGITYPTISGLNNVNYTGISFMEGSPTVAYGYVYIGDTSGKFYQFNATNISQQINNITLIDTIYSSPIVLNNYAYIGTVSNGYMYQLNATNISKQIANFSYGACSLMSNTAIANGFLYVPLTCATMYQLNASNVSQLINTYTGPSSISSVAIAGDYVYVGDIGNFYQLNATNISKVINTFNNGGYMGDTEFSAPLIYNNYAYINDNSGVVYQTNATNISKSIANFTADGTIYGSAAIANGYLYFKTSYTYYQLNATNISQQIATYGPVGGDVKCSPAITNEYAYFGGGNYKGINQLNASNISKLIANYVIEGFTDSTPAIANGYLYVGTADSAVLYQLNASNVSLGNNPTGICPSSGNCLIDCSTNLIIGNLNIPANLTFKGTGKVTINGNLTYSGTNQFIFQYSGCEIDLYKGGRY
jgi:hypothetical protein